VNDNEFLGRSGQAGVQESESADVLRVVSRLHNDDPVELEAASVGRVKDHHCAISPLPRMHGVPTRPLLLSEVIGYRTRLHGKNRHQPIWVVVSQL
jgi:hypothetical protein